MISLCLTCLFLSFLIFVVFSKSTNRKSMNIIISIPISPLSDSAADTFTHGSVTQCDTIRRSTTVPSITVTQHFTNLV